MLPIVSILVIVGLSLLVTRVASVALVHTGLGREAARFQARSAFTGVGFTTSESETIVGHPVRRRIVAALMLMGNVGIVTAMSSVLLSFLGIGEALSVWVPLGVLAAGLAFLVWFSSSEWIDRYLSRLISWALKRFTSMDTRDFARLLHLREDYGVSELSVEDGDWLAGRVLRDSRLADEGVVVLGVECPGGNFIGAPTPGTEIRGGDRLILYGPVPRIREIDERLAGSAGNHAHQQARVEHGQASREELERAGR
jgi:hypothetical protein